MKKLDLSAITGTTGLVVRKQEIVQLNDAIVQIGLVLGQTLTSNALNTLYVLYGCSISGGTDLWSCTAGAIYYNGEIYIVDKVSNAPTTSNTYYFGVKRFNDSIQGTSTTGLINDIYENKIVFYGNVTPSGASTIWATGNYLGRINDLINLQNSIDNNTTAIGLRELLSNKSTTTTLGTSNTLYPTQNAVKTYVDNNVSPLIVSNQTGSSSGLSNISFSDGTGTISSMVCKFERYGKNVTFYMQLKLTVTTTVASGNWNSSGVALNYISLSYNFSGVPVPINSGLYGCDCKAHDNGSFVSFIENNSGALKLYLLDDSSGALFTDKMIVFQGSFTTA